MESLTQTLVLPLTNQKSRLIFRYDNGNEKIWMMYDSGASIPVWCSGDDLLIKAYPDAIKMNLDCNISGFGTGTERGNVYVIPDFKISKGNAAYTIHNLFVISILKPNIGCDFLMSETMFTKTDMTILRRNAREMKILFDDRDYYCTAMRRNGILLDTVIWTQK